MRVSMLDSILRGSVVIGREQVVRGNRQWLRSAVEGYRGVKKPVGRLGL